MHPVFDFIKNGVFMAIIAHGLIGISLVWDKILLKRPGTQNLFSYVFWLGAMSIFGVCLVPFGYTSPTLALSAVAFGAGVIHLAGNFFYYSALKKGEASETLAVLGGFSPVATAAIGYRRAFEINVSRALSIASVARSTFLPTASAFLLKL